MRVVMLKRAVLSFVFLAIACVSSYAQCNGGITGCPAATQVNAGNFFVVAQQGGAGPTGFVTRKATTAQVAAVIIGSLFANPTAQVGLTAVNGVALTAMRSDAAPALNQAISPTWTQPHNFASSINLIGTENAQLSWQIGAAGQSWRMNLTAGGLLYIEDATHATFPFQIFPSAPSGLLVLTSNGIGFNNGTPTANTAQFSLSAGVIIDTAQGVMLDVKSTFTGGTNGAFIENGGTVSNSATASEFVATLSAIANAYLQMIVQGGATPSGTIVTGPSIMGGLAVGTLAGPLTLNSGTVINAQKPVIGSQAGGGSAAAFNALSTLPGYSWIVSGQATDQKTWDAISSGTQQLFRAVNDANSSATSWLVVQRGSGFTITSVTIPTAFSLTGIPTSAGGGGVALCVDTSGVVYKKASCP